MIGVVVGPPTPRQTVHARAPMWLGPACNLGADQAVKLIPGIETRADAVTCWACRHPAEAAEVAARWRVRRAKVLRGAA